MSEEEKIEIQIAPMMKYFLDTNIEKLICFRLAFDGAVYIPNRNHKCARGMIMFPKEICTNDLRELRDWFMLILAIPKEKAIEYINKQIEEDKK